MRTLAVSVYFLAVAICFVPAVGAQALPDILARELNRNFTILKQKGDPAPYYLAYSVNDEETEAVQASRGALRAQNKSRSRILDVTVRVGSPKLDNYRRINGDFPRFTSASAIPLDDNANAIQPRLWADTDRTYRAAAQRLIRIQTDQQMKVAATDGSGDFSEEQPSNFVQPPNKYKFSADEWAVRLRKLSLEFNKYPRILSSAVSVTFQRETKTFVNTEGTRLQHGRSFARILINAAVKAEDGMDLSLGETMEAEDPGHLPKDEVILAAIRKVAENLTALLSAPTVDPFVGPAILSGRASGVFFHEIFGHRVEGHRQKDENEGQTFTKSLGKPVLPEFLSVIFDPTRKNIGGVDLNGYYLYDDEGVKARRLPVVENGILKAFLMSRSPIENFPNSNGHGRRQAGAEVVARQSNLIVESARQVSDAKLRELLKEEIKRQNKPYGLFFQEVSSGYTLTGRRGLQAFTVVPLLVYQVFADGRPDQLVRGVDIVGTPLASFAKILATSDQTAVFNGICGAESGSVPVSAVSPAILVSEIEIQRKEKPEDRPPYLPPPSPSNSGSLPR